MSTLKLENIKHENSATDNLVMDSDGSVTISRINLPSPTSVADGDRIVIQEPSSTLNNDNSHFTINNTAGNGASRAIGFKQSGTTVGQIVYSHDYDNLEIISQKTDAGIAFYTNGFNQNMVLHANGALTTPNSPSFHAFHTGGTTWSNQIIIGNSTSHNIGNHYSTSTGLFTAPVAGTYMFKADWRTTAGAGNWIDIRTSGGRIVRHEENAGDINFYHQSLVMVAYLNANDTAYAYAGSSVKWDANQIDGFSGFLVG